jgi:hypothetical protein
MIELTFGDLKLGLACCTIYKNCTGCPLYRGGELGPVEDCTNKLLTAAMNCINVLEKDLTEANKRAAMWEEHSKNIQEKQIERL